MCFCRGITTKDYLEIFAVTTEISRKSPEDTHYPTPVRPNLHSETLCFHEQRA